MLRIMISIFFKRRNLVCTSLIHVAFGFSFLMMKILYTICCLLLMTQLVMSYLLSLLQVSEEYKLVPDTLYLTVYLIDRFLSRNYIERQRLQLLGITSMLVAS
jgi:hypothetical protein